MMSLFASEAGWPTSSPRLRSIMYDAVIAFSVFKWIHLNGDEGFRRDSYRKAHMAWLTFKGVSSSISARKTLPTFSVKRLGVSVSGEARRTSPSRRNACS
ncbi:hypothetical protein PM082_006216 [Marasmius tenuissimus]|nr:hypothetical protein PM082_006216 [Marasmius tenuissimus]